MNMERHVDHRDDSDDSDDRIIRELMRDSAYEGRPRDEFKRDLLRELNHNFAYHRLRTRVLVATLVTMGSLAAVMRVTDVGSDGFGLFPTGEATNTGPILEAPFVGERFNPIDAGAGLDTQTQGMQDVYEQIAAGGATLVQVTGWTIHGKTSFTAVIQVTVDGEQTLIHRRVSGGDLEFSRQLAAFLAAYEAEFLDAVENGEIPQEPVENAEVLGATMAVTRWTRIVAPFGQVTYWRGKPAP